MKVLSFDLTCEQYQRLCTHISSIGGDVWETFSDEEKEEEIREYVMW